MLVKDYMTKHPMMVEPKMPIIEAQRYMGENDIRHLPVVGKGNRLVGLVSRERLLIQPATLDSLDVWEISRFLSELTLGDVMVPAKAVVTIGKEETIEEAARIMVRNKVGCLPVVDERGAVEGIITKTDLLAQLMEMLGARVSGVRVTVRMPNVVGETAKLICAVGSQGWRIPAFSSVPSPKNPDTWDAMIKIRDVAKEAVIDVVRQVKGHEIIDIRET